jgi:hypothetical protein
MTAMRVSNRQVDTRIRRARGWSRIYLLAVLVACDDTMPGDLHQPPQDTSRQISLLSVSDETSFSLAHSIVQHQRAFLALLAGVNDSTSLLGSGFQLIDRDDDAAPLGGPWATAPSTLALLARRMPPEELQADQFELWRQEDGSVAVVSRISSGHNITIWERIGTIWTARALILNPTREDLGFLRENATPLLAGEAR